jgi:hypothetical protein
MPSTHQGAQHSSGCDAQAVREDAALKLVRGVLEAGQTAGATDGSASNASVPSLQVIIACRCPIAFHSTSPAACVAGTPADHQTMVTTQAYVLKRLVRGLGSGRQGARQGFALALAALLSARPEVTPASVMELMDQHLPFSKSMQARGRVLCPVHADAGKQPNITVLLSSVTLKMSFCCGVSYGGSRHLKWPLVSTSGMHSSVCSQVSECPEPSWLMHFLTHRS